VPELKSGKGRHGARCDDGAQRGVAGVKQHPVRLPAEQDTGP
jgi:hypothetical protein